MISKVAVPKESHVYEYISAEEIIAGEDNVHLGKIYMSIITPFHKRTLDIYDFVADFVGVVLASFIKEKR